MNLSGKKTIWFNYQKPSMTDNLMTPYQIKSYSEHKTPRNSSNPMIEGKSIILRVKS